MLEKLWIFFLVSLGVVSVVAWIVAIMHEKGIRPVRKVWEVFKAQSVVGRAFLAMFSLVLLVVASVKPPGGGNRGGPSAMDEWELLAPITSTNTTRTLEAEDFRRGFVLAGVGTGEQFDFSAPSNAVVCSDWLAFGAAEDWIYVGLTNWAFQIGTNDVERFRIHSDGWVEAGGSCACMTEDGMDAQERVPLGFWPLNAVLGIVPEANWHLLDNPQASISNLQSRFWHLVTPSNTLQMTWQNVLLGRDTNTPASVQMELWPSGKFSYRYDLSRLDVEEVTNLLVGASLGGVAWTTNSIPTNVTTLSFWPLSAEDAVDFDRDGDGLSLLDELFAYGTDPDLVDTSGDGISDGSAVALGLDPLLRHVPDEDILARVAASSTNDAFGAVVAATNLCVYWKLFDGFAAVRPTGATNLVWERTFAVNRTSAWQQFFVSALPTNAAAWSLYGMALEWEADTGTSGSAVASPCGDSLRIPLDAEDMPSALTLRLRAVGGFVRSPTPLHLVAYVPEFRIEGGTTITGQSGAEFQVFTRGSESIMRLVVDQSRRPHRAPPGADEREMRTLDDFEMISGGLAFDGNVSGGTVTARRPGAYELPDISLGVPSSAPPLRSHRRGGSRRTIIVLDPSAWWSCEVHGCGFDGLGYDWDGDRYYEEDYYPLDSRCLRKSWQTVPDSGWSHSNCELCVSDGAGGAIVVSTSIDDGCASVSVDGVQVWSKRPKHGPDNGNCGNDYREEFLGDGCDSCETDCANGNCDSLEGPTLGSLKFRIPLGAFAKGYVVGFAWFSADGPIAVSKSAFQLTAHPGADVTDTLSAGVRRIVSHESRGRDLRIEDIANGVRVTIYDTAAQTLEHTWEIVNVGGDTSCVRLRKISRLDNVMSDETFTCSGGDWTQFDNIAGLGTLLEEWGDLLDGGDGVKGETRTITDAGGNIVSTVITEQSRVGECDNAVIRETYREEYSGNGWKWSRADYWNDPQNHSRHGKPRLVWGNARAWEYTDFDEDGSETLRVEQRGDTEVPSAFPYVISNELYETSLLKNAFVTVKDYEPLAGDANHKHDSSRPRTETRYVATNGVLTLIGRTLSRYTRLVRDGYPVIKHETWRTAENVPSATINYQLPTANSYSYEITYAETGEATPFLMRGAVAESLDENGVLTVNAYSLSNGVLTCDARRYGPFPVPNSPFPTYDTTVQDATYGTTLRRTTRLTDGDTIIADEQSVYDGQNRLRSTTFLDGTSLTNAYSCCRLLWKRDRQNRKTLRSAQTGTDHLYNAMEEVWITNLTGRAAILAAPTGTGVSPVDGFRVTQHFYDALGRETNTVTYVGVTPGEAAVPIGEAALLPLQHTGGSQLVATATTSYPYGGSSYSIHTDERGVETTTSTSYGDGYVERNVYTATNGTDILRTTTRTYHGGGSSVRREWLAPPDAGGSQLAATAWTEERRFTEYAPNGYRIDYVVTTSSDHPAVTNSISTYDLLGRLITTATPIGEAALSPLQSGPAWLVTSNAYDGATSRIVTTTYTAGDIIRTTAYLYNDWGDQVGTVLDGITNRTDTTYETDASNIVWRVETSTVIGPSTNSLTIVRTQLTGLSNSCRRHTVTLTGTAAILAAQGTGVLSVDDSLTESLVIFDPSTGIETETVTSSTAPTVVRRYLHGVLLSTETTGETTYNTYDAFTRLAMTGRAAILAAPSGTTNVLPVASYYYAPVGDLLATHTYTNGTDYITESYAYDMLGNRISTTDAHGNTIYRTYDPFGRVLSEWGATYPVRYTYDTQGRRTSLTTFRTTGGSPSSATDGDTTTWTYDPYTGNYLSKTYADGSTVTYTYTPDNLPLRTTYASGKWKENVYNAQRRLCGVVYSSPGMDYELQLDAYGRTVWESNSVCTISYALADAGTTTNEVISVGDEVMSIARTLDGQDRLVGLAVPDSDYEANHVYAGDGNIENISNDLACVSYLYSSNRLDVGYSIRLANGTVFQRYLYRDDFRRSLVTNITTVVNGNPVESLTYSFDAASRPITRNGDVFGYNARNEVVAAMINGNSETHEYDNIGNSIRASFNVVTNTFVANKLNQYTAIKHNAAPLWEASHDIDGNMTQCGDWTYTYDARHQLKSVSSNGVLLVTNYCDAKSRRVRKVTPNATMTFFYDDWNLIEERIAYVNGTTSTIHYYWGKDISGTLQGAGGVGGLLYLTVNGTIYIPCYDNNGNITRYLDSSGNTIAQYTFDAFGNFISKSGPLADFFRHRLSTKYFDAETGLYYCDYRFYSPPVMRWLNRDPVAENGGLNQYAFCRNNALSSVDPLGLDRYMTTFSADPRKDQWHVGVAVDTWKCSDGRWIKTGVVTFDFCIDDSSFLNRLGTFFVTMGTIVESDGNNLVAPFTIFSTPKQDIEMLNRIRSQIGNPPLYSFFFNNCIHWATEAIDYGMDK